MAGRKPILINLKATAPSGDVKFFSSFPEAAREMGFSEYGVRKAYYSKRNRTGEYKLEWLEPILKEEKEEPKRKRKPKPKPKTKIDKIKGARAINCFSCEKPLTGKNRMDFDSFSTQELNDKGKEASTISPSSLYEASKETGLSLGALRNARDTGNTLLTRRRDKKFRVYWGASHDACFQARKEKRRGEEREKDLAEWRIKVRRRPSFQKLLEKEAKERANEEAKENERKGIKDITGSNSQI